MNLYLPEFSYPKILNPSNVSVKSKLQPPPPPGYTSGIWRLYFPVGGEFEPYTYGVGNLNFNLDFMLHVLVMECGLINHGGARHAGSYGEF